MSVSPEVFHRRRRARRRLTVGLSVLAVTALIGAVVVTSAKSPPPVRYSMGEPGDLRLQESQLVSFWGHHLPAESGRLVVAENREDPATDRRIEIAFLRLRTAAEVPQTPIVVLAGGPGSTGGRFGRGRHFYAVRELLARSDVVLVDQRGAGDSIPNLACDDQLELDTDVATAIEAATLERYRSAMGDCLDSLRRRGVDLAAYQSWESAADLDELRAALGYERWALWGIGYGSELASVYLRRFPERVERLVLTGPTAPDLALELPGGFRHQLEVLDRAVQRDRLLSRRIPDLPALVERVHDRLRNAPQRIRVPLIDPEDTAGEPPPVRALLRGVSFFRESWVMTLGEVHLQLLLLEATDSEALLERLPAIYHHADRGDYDELGNRLRRLRSRRLPNALTATVGCATGYSAERWRRSGSESHAALVSRPVLARWRAQPTCATWGLVPTHPELLEPETTDRPVLMIVGDLDGQTPPASVRELERRYLDHRTIVVRNAGSASTLNGEVLAGILAFLDGREPPVLEVEQALELDPLADFERDLAHEVVTAYREGGPTGGDAFLRARIAEQKRSDDPLYDFRAAYLNRIGYRLLRSDATEEAVSFFRIAVELHPLSWNLRDSLAEAELEAGDLATATADYRRSIDLYPLNANGFRMLERIERRRRRDPGATPATPSPSPPPSARSAPG